MESGSEYDITAVDSSCSPSSGVSAVVLLGLDKACLTHPIMLWAYACSLVLLSLGFVVLIVGFAFLSVWHPERFQYWWLVIGLPMGSLMISHLPTVIKRWKNGQ